MDLAGKVYENPKKYNRCRTGSSVSHGTDVTGMIEVKVREEGYECV